MSTVLLYTCQPYTLGLLSKHYSIHNVLFTTCHPLVQWINLFWPFTNFPILNLWEWEGGGQTCRIKYMVSIITCLIHLNYRGAKLFKLHSQLVLCQFVYKWATAYFLNLHHQRITQFSVLWIGARLQFWMNRGKISKIHGNTSYVYQIIV